MPSSRDVITASNSRDFRRRGVDRLITAQRLGRPAVTRWVARVSADGKLETEQLRRQCRRFLSQRRREHEVPILQRLLRLLGEALRLIVLSLTVRREATVVHAVEVTRGAGQ